MRRAVALLALALALGGCGLRVDAPDPTPPTPAANEVVRQREALRADALAGASGTVGTHAAAQRDALGGIWMAWPQGDGPAPSAAPTADIATPTSPTELLAALRSTTPDLTAAALAVTDGELATLLASIAVARTLDERALAGELGANPAPLPALPDEVATADAALVRSLDAAAWAYEVHAAAAVPAEAARLAARATRLRHLAGQAALANGWSGTAQDPREPVYDIAELPAPARIEQDLLGAFLADFAATQDRAAHLAAMLNCAGQSASAGAELGSLPGLPTPAPERAG